MRTCFLTVLALSFSLVVVPAQEIRSVIYGRVVDPQATVVAGAKVTVTNADTNTTVALTTNQTGYFEANFLLPGNYRLTAESTGFKTTIRSGIVVPVGTRLEIDLKLELGNVTESISVVAEAPLLETTAMSAGRVIDNRSVSDLPIMSGNAVLLAKLAPGIFLTDNNRYAPISLGGAPSSFVTSGGIAGNEYSIDGAPNLGQGREIAAIPHADAVQEVKVDTAGFDAAIGHAAGANVMLMTKAGTNSYRGTLSEQHWQNRWRGTPSSPSSFTTGTSPPRRPAATTDWRKNYARGPSSRPAVPIPTRPPSAGRWSFQKSITAETACSSSRLTRASRIRSPPRVRKTAPIPTPANRQGDFSQLLNVDATRYQIYDPLSVRANPARPTHYIRDPIPGNILPASRVVNPVYNSYVKFLPTPNNPGTNPRLEPLNNYIATATPYDWDYQSFNSRVDFELSQKHRFFARGSWNEYKEDRQDWTYESARTLMSAGLNRINSNGTIDWVYTPAPSTVLDTTFSVNNFYQTTMIMLPLTFKPTDVGLPAYLDAKAGDLTILPQMIYAGYPTLSELAPDFKNIRMITLKSEVTHIRGNHTLRAGIDVRQHVHTGQPRINSSGSFSFSNMYTRKEDDGNTPAGDLGHSWAAFMMGIPTAMSVDTADTWAQINPYYGWFAQDTWRVTRKLTVTLGQRLEVELGPTERYNRIIGWFDPTVKLPITDAAQAAYAKSPVAERPAADFTVTGGSVYPGSGGADRREWKGETMWMPRVGAAYQLDSKTVLRGAYGIFYDTLNVLQRVPNQLGYTRTTSTVVTTDFGQNWLAGNPSNGVPPMADPFPVRSDGTRFDTPVRDALGAMAVAGRSFTFNSYDTRHARQQRWRAGIQRQIGPNMLIEVAYSGSASGRVYISKPLQPLPEKYWASGTTRNDAIANNLNANVTNPFNIANFSSLSTSNPLVYRELTTNGFFTSTTIRKERLLRQFPQMSGLTQSMAPDGKVRTDGLEVTFQRRLSRGVNVSASYMRLRNEAADYYYNEFDAEPTWRESGMARPHRFVSTGIWELPFGKGRPFLNSGLGRAVLGGFQISLSYEFAPGPLLGFGNVFYYGNTADITKGERTLDRWFNTENFERSASKGPAGFHRRVFDPHVDGLRADCLNWWNGNVLRDFRVTERVTFQVRVDAINLMNRSQFAAPDMSPYSTNFGRVSATTSSLNRHIQVQGRIRF